jgi:hypothetical protein
MKLIIKKEIKKLIIFITVAIRESIVNFIKKFIIDSKKEPIK